MSADSNQHFMILQKYFQVENKDAGTQVFENTVFVTLCARRTNILFSFAEHEHHFQKSIKFFDEQNTVFVGDRGGRKI